MFEVADQGVGYVGILTILVVLILSRALEEVSHIDATEVLRSTAVDTLCASKSPARIGLQTRSTGLSIWLELKGVNESDQITKHKY